MITNYSFRYIDPHAKVYMIYKVPNTKQKGVGVNLLNLNHIRFYTSPFVNKNTQSVTNVLTGFSSPELAKELTKRKGGSLEAIDVQEFLGYAALLKMPTVIVVNSYCNLDEGETDDMHYEVFYKDFAHSRALDFLNDVILD